MATVARSDSSSDSGNCGPFASLLANDTSAIVETVQEGGSDDGEEWPGVNLNPRLSDAYNDPNLTCDSGIQDLIIDTNDPGRANFALNVGALGNASGTLMDGAQDMSFGESTVDKGYTVDGDEGATSNYNHQDPSDPDVMAALLTQPPVADPHSPTTKRFDEQVHYAKSYRPFELFVNENYKL